MGSPVSLQIIVRCIRRILRALAVCPIRYCHLIGAILRSLRDYIFRKIGYTRPRSFSSSDLPTSGEPTLDTTFSSEAFTTYVTPSDGVPMVISSAPLAFLPSEEGSLLPESSVPAATSTIPLPLLESTITKEVETWENSDSLTGVSDFIYPILPSRVFKYSKERLIGQLDANLVLKPTQTSFPLGLPQGWVEYTHPEGQPFFYHLEKRIITETWIWDASLWDALTDFITQIEDFIHSRNLHGFPEDVHLVLECSLVEGEAWYGYYYVSHSTRNLFWLETFDIATFLPRDKDFSQAHIKTYLEYEYWCHWDVFPNVNMVTMDVLDLLANIIRDTRTEVRMNPESAINYRTEDLNDMAEIVESARRQLKYSPPSSWFVGKFMSLLAHSRFLTLPGKHDIRPTRKDPSHKAYEFSPSLSIRMLSPMLYSAPIFHLNTMQGILGNKLTVKAHWVEFFSKLTSQWSDHIIHASILLNANVAFLAIPSNDPSNNSDIVIPFRSALQIASYLSIVTSFASMMLALRLVRQYKTKEHGTAGEFREFLRRRGDYAQGLETLAVMYSLPYAMLMWGMVTFLIAFLLMCFNKTSLAPRSIVGSTTALISILVLWCIWLTSEGTGGTDWWRWAKLMSLRLWRKRRIADSNVLRV